MKLEPAIAAVPYQDRDRYLLCSDGVTDMLSDREIEEIMKLEDSIRDIAHALLTRVLDKGARDNTTIILCEVRAESAVQNLAFAEEGINQRAKFFTI